MTAPEKQKPQIKYLIYEAFQRTGLARCCTLGPAVQLPKHPVSCRPPDTVHGQLHPLGALQTTDSHVLKHRCGESRRPAVHGPRTMGCFMVSGWCGTCTAHGLHHWGVVNPSKQPTRGVRPPPPVVGPRTFTPPPYGRNVALGGNPV